MSWPFSRRRVATVPCSRRMERKRSCRSRVHFVFVLLLPHLTELLVYDNTEEGDPQMGKAPEPELLLHLERAKIVDSCDLALTPQWAKPILAAALKLPKLG